MSYKRITRTIIFLMVNLLINISCSGDKVEINCSWMNDLNNIFEPCLKMANEGNAVAQRFIGNVYSTEFDITKLKPPIPTDDTKALKWYAKALAPRNAKKTSEKNIVKKRYTDKLTESDIYGIQRSQVLIQTKRLKLTKDKNIFYDLETLANQGNVHASNWLRKAYRRGLKYNQSGVNVDADHDKYVKYTFISAENGDAIVAIDAAEILYSTKKYAEALKWYKKLSANSPQVKLFKTKVAEIEKKIAELKSSQK